MRESQMLFKLDSLGLLADDKAFAALADKYQQVEGLNYLAFTFHATAPTVNAKAMAITLPTMSRSVVSAMDKMVDYEHIAEDIPRLRDMEDDPETRIVGYIKEVIMSDEPDPNDESLWLLHPYIPKDTVITRGVMALFTRVGWIKNIANEIRAGGSWYFSLEIGENVTDPEIWLRANGDGSKNEIIAWNEASPELQQIASEPRPMYFEGRQVAYLMGGRDGTVPFIGGGITQNPAGFEQKRPGGSMRFIASMQQGGDMADKSFVGPWSRAFVNSLPDSSFLIIEGDYGAGKTKNKDCRHLPVRNENGNIDLAHLSRALSVADQIIAVAGPESSDELRAKAKRKLAKYRQYLKSGKAASDDKLAPIVVESFEQLIQLYDGVDSFMKLASDDSNNDQGGEDTLAKVELTDEELAKKLADARKEGKDEGLSEGASGVLDKAFADGTAFKPEDVEKLAGEKATTLANQQILKRDRDAAIAALPCDDDMKKDFTAMSDRFELTEDGQKEFNSSVERWKTNLKTASEDKGADDKGADDKGKDDKGSDDKGKEDKGTASTGDGKNFDPGSGGGGKGADDDAPQQVPTFIG